MQIALVVMGAVGANPGDRDSALEQEVWMSYKHTFSRLQAVIRYHGVVDSRFRLHVYAIANHVAAGSGTSIAGSSYGGRATPICSPKDSITTVATRAATVKYRATPTCVAISWDFQISVLLAVTFRARCQDTFR